MPTARTTGRRGDAEFGKNHLAQRDDLADLDHFVLLHISTTALPLSSSPTERVDPVDVVDVFLVNT